MSVQEIRKISEETKLTFLEKTLQKNPQLQRELMAFAQNISTTSPPTIEDPESYIEEIAVELQEDLEALNLSDPDWEFYTPRHGGYIPEYEAIEHMNEDQVAEVIDGYSDAIELYCQEKRFDEAFLIAVGCYDACVIANLDDEHESLPDATDFMFTTLQEILHKLNSILKMVAIPENQLHTVFQSTFIHSRKKYGDDAAMLRFFEPLLLSLITGHTQAAIVNSLVEDQNVPHKNIPRIVSRVTEILNGDDAWEQTALQLFTEDKQLAEELLQYYAKDDKASFIKIANELWQKELFRNDFAKFYFEIIQPEDDATLYKEVTKYLLIKYRDLKYYKAIRNLLTGQEGATLLNENIRYHSLYVEMLHLEKRYEDAINFIETKVDHYELATIIRPFVHIYPAKSFRIISKTIREALAQNKGRELYKVLVDILKVAADIKEMKTAVNGLISDLYNRRPALPAMKDELRSGGLWPVV